jgi:hypothetical protein
LNFVGAVTISSDWDGVRKEIQENGKIVYVAMYDQSESGKQYKAAMNEAQEALQTKIDLGEGRKGFLTWADDPMETARARMQPITNEDEERKGDDSQRKVRDDQGFAPITRTKGFDRIQETEKVPVPAELRSPFGRIRRGVNTREKGVRVTGPQEGILGAPPGTNPSRDLKGT